MSDDQHDLDTAPDAALEGLDDIPHTGEAVEGTLGSSVDVVVGEERPGFVTDVTFGEYLVTIGVARVDDVVLVVQYGAYPDGASDARALTTELLERAVARVTA